jgi:hypothetical protein
VFAAILIFRDDPRDTDSHTTATSSQRSSHASSFTLLIVRYAHYIAIQCHTEVPLCALRRGAAMFNLDLKLLENSLASVPTVFSSLQHVERNASEGVVFVNVHEDQLGS